jgi:hypothetical protein
MGAADTAGDVDAGDELLEVAVVGDVDNVDDLDIVDGAVALLRAGELCALAEVNGPSASIAMAINGTVNFMKTLSLFRLSRGCPETTAPCLGRPHRR